MTIYAVTRARADQVLFIFKLDCGLFRVQLNQGSKPVEFTHYRSKEFAMSHYESLGGK